ncbi:unnamed protein product [Peniophora sp. CBMAI 1063]|nr:unnamed protein product [Peniophora sp. CBMAI 1063]
MNDDAESSTRVANAPKSSCRQPNDKPTMLPGDLQYKLPPVVKSITNGYTTTLASGEVVSSIIAGVEAQLIGFYNGDSKLSANPNAKAAVMIMTYIAFLCSISATIDSLLLTDDLAELASRSTRARPDEVDLTTTVESQALKKFGTRAGFSFIMKHWITSLSAACLCTIASAVVHAVIQGSLATTVTVPIIAAFSALPFFWPILAVPGKDFLFKRVTAAATHASTSGQA